MWLRKEEWNEVLRRVERCEQALKRQKEENKENLIILAKRILREPEKLSEELDAIENIENYVNDFIHS